MPTGFASQKVPGGKLLQVEATCADGLISSVRITGDFFMHPEDAITDLEKALVGCRTDAGVSEMISRLKRVIEDRHIELIGVGPEHIAGTAIEALVTCQI